MGAGGGYGVQTSPVQSGGYKISIHFRLNVNAFSWLIGYGSQAGNSYSGRGGGGGAGYLVIHKLFWNC